MYHSIFEALSALFSALITPSEKTIEQNITLLLKENWFINLYNNEQYRNTLKVDSNSRQYLGYKTNLKKLLADAKEREKFIKLLEEESKCY